TALTPFRSSLSTDADPPAPRSFPTRRSSDLYSFFLARSAFGPCAIDFTLNPIITRIPAAHPRPACFIDRNGSDIIDGRIPPEGRSEEHTSELQSRENLVCRLLLAKKTKEENL